MWQERIEIARAKGQTAASLACEFGVRPSTVHYWKKGLQEDEPPPATSPTPTKEIRLAKVSRRGLEANASQRRLEITFGRVCVRVEDFDDVEALANLLLQLSGGSS